ncbi:MULTISPECIES: ABC transporter substrate-binding protein [Brevibacillus]|jgi:peptide/nickel transport system substrate-binding protein|uniref:ABC transporter substrate-binding protein n=1 Tax=Brevibacillus borstelensis AK1 TaxID=1300222 RepID=M8E5M6_9BACL|nr:ABC transporter substrate-binding protein [Brevibacillus borstelensis]EMT50775.1 ABC transporter substrate-binding protein [Brevibacillus borstelensis AK1]KKX55910.1 peptide ABC transporter substrate-binding protein [Brevibacillus borstelensis cifa_chp40]MBE5396732.1 ABC transporter substrate-binding protein [Brevibacillus borstelensis]MCC0564470.1 ABC transporter substrate-binding protein [Brevibacillus borstelensis]MCM3471176.1 ABC transporter substrate-binding protein [Brevibacillus bors
MKKKVLTAAMTSLLALSMVLAGCSSSQPAQQPSDQGQAQQQTPPAEPAKNEPKQLIIGRGADTKSLDPIRETDGETFRVTENIYETLVSYEDTNTTVIPGLAESWEISEDGLTYTFKLRQGVKFHDGTDFNAEAVKFNFDRWMDKSNKYHNPEGFPYYNDMFGGYKGDPDHVIKEIKVVDAHTIQFVLNRTQAPFLANLGMSPFAIASPKAIEGGKLGDEPVGTGPFKFAGWKRNDIITLEKNPDYWNKGYPKLDKVIFKVIPENTARLTALTSGEIDLMDGLNPDDAEAVKENKDLQLLLRPSMNVGYLAFNTEKKPFDNPKVRQAISHAINKPEMVKAFYSGLGEPATNPMPPSLWGYNDQIKDREYNLDQAKKLLAEAGYPNGFKVQFMAMPVPRPYIPDGKKMAEAIQQDLKKIGIETEIVTMEWATYLEKTRLGEYEMCLLGWNGDNGDPDNFLYTLLDKNTINGNNIPRYSNEEVHQLLLKAQSTSDQKERETLYKKAQELIFNDAPLVPIAHSTPPIAAKAGVTGYQPHPKGSESVEKVDIQ